MLSLTNSRGNREILSKWRTWSQYYYGKTKNTLVKNIGRHKGLKAERSLVKPRPDGQTSLHSGKITSYQVRHAGLKVSYCSVPKSCLFVSPWSAAHQASLSTLCPLSRWCHPTTSSSVTPFSSCPQSFPASGSFPITWPKHWSFSFSISSSNEYSGLDSKIKLLALLIIICKNLCEL